MTRTSIVVLYIMAIITLGLTTALLLQVTEVIDIEGDVRAIVTGHWGKQEISMDEEAIIKNCNSTNLESAVSCVNNEIEKVYKFKTRDDSDYLSYEELKNQGGDCLNYARLYVRLLEEIGFEGKVHRIGAGESRHAFATIINNQGYCIMDNKFYDCFNFT